MRSPKSSQVTLGLIQMACGEDPRQNLDQGLTKITQAARGGAQIVCLQELFRSRYFCQVNETKFFELAEEVPGPTTEILAKTAREKKIVIVASLFEKDGKKFYNTAVVLDADGSPLGKYRKVHIPNDPHNFYSEAFYFTPGDLGLKAFTTRYAKIGVQICWDQWFPEGARSLALQGAEILFYPTAIGWPLQGNLETGRVEHEAWMTVQRGHAISNTVFVATPNRIGIEDHLKFWGSSFVSDPFGKVLAKAGHEEAEVLLVGCDLTKIDSIRKDWPFLTCRRTDSYSL